MRAEGDGRVGMVTLAIAGVLAVFVAVAAPAAASTQVGATFDPSGVLGGSGVTDLQSGSPAGQYTIPFSGVITSWSFQAAAANVPTLKFKVGRSVGGTDIRIVGEDGPRTPVAGKLNTYPTRIPVQAGDLIGDYRVSGGLFARNAGSDYSVQTIPGDPASGDTVAFNAPGSGLQLDLSATLEPPATGRRAAALKKCKKKHSRKKRKKCRKKANKLPV